MSLFAGIDGGGSKTLAVIVDETGCEVGRGLVGSANYQVLMAQGFAPEEAASMVANHVTEALGKAMAENVGDLYAGFAGLAGASSLADIALLEKALDNTKLCPPGNWQAINDAELILCGLSETKGIGLGLVAGTGSIVVGRNYSGQKAVAGGWGYIFGDEGSGYALGCAALQVAAQAADKRGPATRLLPLILSEWNLATPETLIEAVYQSGEGRNQKIARLAPLVFDAAADGDLIAQNLVDNAAFELARAVKAVYERLEFGSGQNPALGLGGGMLLNTPELKKAVITRLTEFGCNIAQVIEVPDPAKAAALACLSRHRLVTTRS